jgi:hypothetical protein
MICSVEKSSAGFRFDVNEIKLDPYQAEPRWCGAFGLGKSMTENKPDRETSANVALRDLQNFDYKFEYPINLCAFYSLLETHGMVTYPMFEKSITTVQRLRRECKRMEGAFNEAELATMSPLIEKALKRLRDTDKMLESMREAEELFEKAKMLSQSWGVLIAGFESDLKEISRCFRYAVKAKRIVNSQNT